MRKIQRSKIEECLSDLTVFVSMARDKRTIVLSCLALQHTQHAVLLSYARQRPGPKYTISVVVATAEMLKLSLNLAAHLATRTPTADGPTALESVRSIFWPSRADALSFAVPAALYTASNNLQMLGASRLTPIVYQICNQLRIPLTALVWQLVLHKTISRTQWISVLALTAGVILVVVEPEDVRARTLANHHTKARSFVHGVLLVLAACACATLASVWFERLLKTKRHGAASNSSVFESNSRLAVFALPAACLAVIFGDSTTVSKRGLYWAFDRITFAVLLSHSLGGFLVSLTLKLADNVLKTFATAVSLILTCLVSALLFDRDLSPSFVIGVLVVIASTLLYAAAPNVLDRPLGVSGYSSAATNEEESAEDALAPPRPSPAAGKQRKAQTKRSPAMAEAESVLDVRQL